MRTLIPIIIAIWAIQLLAQDCPTFSYPDSTMLGQKFSVIDSLLQAKGYLDANRKFAYQNTPSMLAEWGEIGKDFQDLCEDNNPYGQFLYDLVLALYIEGCIFDSTVGEDMYRKRYIHYHKQSIHLFFYIDNNETLLFMVEKDIPLTLPKDDRERKPIFDEAVKELTRKTTIRPNVTNHMFSDSWIEGVAIFKGKSKTAYLYCPLSTAARGGLQLLFYDNSLMKKYRDKIRLIRDQNIKSKAAKAKF